MAEARAPREGRHPRSRGHGRRPGPGDRGPAARRVARATRVLLLFLDGVGIGVEDPEVNPFLQARLPVLEALLGGALPTLEQMERWATPSPDDAAAPFVGHVTPLDATLDVEGTPQSGTGQAALLTGADAACLCGRHFGPWTPVRLRPLVEEESVLRRVLDRGGSVAFANAYPRGWPGPRGGRRIAGPPLAARGAGVLDRHEESLGRGEAVSSEIVNDGWKQHLGHHALPDVTPREAGTNLARITAAHDLTLYAHYATDTAGHRGRMAGAVHALERVDDFLGGVLAALPSDTLLVVASDHGNIEDVRVGHTRNPALGVVATVPGSVDAGPREELPRDLREVTPYILEALSANHLRATDG